MLVIDDERPALDELAFLLDRDDRASARCHARLRRPRRCGCCRSSEVDAVFLDIQMPGLTGLELAQVLSRFQTPPPVVFVTAHEEHAVDAFELDAVDYVLKPVREDRLAEAVRRVVEARRGAARRRRGRRSRSSSAASPGSCPLATSPTSRRKATTPGCTPPTAAT